MKAISAVLCASLLCFSCARAPVTVIIISADAEWKALKKYVHPKDGRYGTSPYGEWFFPDGGYYAGGKTVIFFHGGWGKIDAAGSAQYAISRWRPERIINLGTAGGFPGKTFKGDIVIVTRAVSYDIYERMGDGAEAVDYYSTDLTVPALSPRPGMQTGCIASADQDVLPQNVPALMQKYNAIAGDWESAAIAHVAKKNGIPCHIIRGITDMVYPSGSEAYGKIKLFEAETGVVMKKLLDLLKEII